MKRLRKAAQGNYYNAQEIADKNHKIIQETGDTAGCVSFEWHGSSITDPFYDESSVNPVDPVEYYGDAFLNSPFAK